MGWIIAIVIIGFILWTMIGEGIFAILGFIAALVVGFIIYCIISNIHDEKKEKELKNQAESGDINAQFDFGVWLMKKNKLEDSMHWLEEAKKSGHESALTKIEECQKKMVDAERAKREAEEKEAQEAARPRCSYCRMKIDDKAFEKYGVVVGTRLYERRFKNVLLTNVYPRSPKTGKTRQQRCTV